MEPPLSLKDAVVPCVAIFVVLFLGLTFFSFNFLVDTDVNVLHKQANVQTALQLRADLIPNVIKTIQASGKYESSTLKEIVELRSQVGQVRSGIDAATTSGQLQSGGDQLDGIIGRLLLIYEQYPELKTTAQYQQLETQLATNEEMVRTSRNEYNAAVADYQQVTRSVPTNFYAAAFGFRSDRYSMFAARPGSDQVPEVAF